MTDVDSSEVARHMSDVLEKVFGDASVASVFSEPSQVGDTMVERVPAVVAAGPHR